MYEEQNRDGYQSSAYQNLYGGGSAQSGSYTGTQQSGSYTGTQQGGPAAQGPEDGKGASRKKKEGSFLKKLGTSAACALVFGAVAGGTFIGVTKTAGTAAPAPTEAVAEAQTEPETLAAPEEARALPDGGTSVFNEENSNPFIASDVPAEEKDPMTIAQNAQKVVLDVSDIVEKAMPSVVAINVKGEQTVSSLFGYSRTYETEGAGSGILIGENDDEYLIVTNNHVVENTKSMTVQFIDGENADAELKGTDSGRDVAVIAVNKKDVKDETKGKIAIAEMGDSDSLKVGQGVIAIGNALGYGQSVTVGYVSATNRSITAADAATGETKTVENLLQTDAAINPGNSGGALLDMEGRVIGINESKSVDTTVEGMGYAIPISSVSELIETLSAQKTRATVAEENRGYIGFQGTNVDSDAAQKFNMPVGIFVYRILEGGAAANSELQEQDIITKLDGMTVTSIEELKDKLTRYEKGEVVTLTVQRPNGKEYNELEIQVTLAAQGEVGDSEGAEEEKAEAEQEAPEKNENGGRMDEFGGSDFWNDFFGNGGFQFRW